MLWEEIGLCTWPCLNILALGDEAQLAGFGDGLGTAINVELAVDVFSIPLDGVGGKEHLLGDLGVRETCGEQAQHF